MIKEPVCEHDTPKIEQLRCRVMEGMTIRAAYKEVFPRYYLDTTPEQRKEIRKLKADKPCNPCVMPSFISQIRFNIPTDRHKKFKKYCKQQGVDMSQMLNRYIRVALEEFV